MIDWKKFAVVALAPEKEAFIVHMAYLGSKMLIYLAQKPQIALLLGKKIFVFEKYADFSNIFSKNLW